MADTGVSEMPQPEVPETKVPEPEVPKYKFSRNHSYKLPEKNQLAKLIFKFKKENEELLMNPKKQFNSKTGKTEIIKPTGGYISKAVRQLYENLTDAKSTDRLFKNAVKMADRYFKKHFDPSVSSFEKPPPSKSRMPGGGRKTLFIDVRDELFNWFIDIR